MPKIIHISLSVIDNLGDIGFACEIVRSFHEEFEGVFEFIIWTEDQDRTHRFFEKNHDDISHYEIRQKERFQMHAGEILFLLFHDRLPEILPEKGVLILRIDYLSFDRDWVEHHGSEHIESRAGRRIIEIIPSPLEQGGGLISPTGRFLDRDTLARRFSLDPEKRWMSIFAYPETLEEFILLDAVKDSEIIVLGRDAPSEHDKREKYLPFLSQREFTSIMRESVWAIVRGEVSLISSMQIETPLLWDMYKEKGGWHGEQAEQFLDWIEADSKYRELFEKINGRKEGKVNIHELDHYFQSHTWEKNKEYKSLSKEIKKYIDSFYNSL